MPRPPSKKGKPAAPRTARAPAAPAPIDVARTSRADAHLFEIRDAQKVLEAARKHRASLRERGLTDEELAAYDAQIKLATSHEARGGRVSLESARQRVKDLLGDYRTAADLATRSLRGRDAALAAVLRVEGAFPDDDAALASYLDDIAAPVAKHADALAFRGFSRGEQAELAAAADAYRRALDARPEAAERLRRESAERKQVLAALREMTKYVRWCGRAATRTSRDRADFDRPQDDAVAAERAASAAARRAAKTQARVEERTAKAQAEAARAQARAAAVEARVAKAQAEAQAKAEKARARAAKVAARTTKKKPARRKRK